MLREYEQILPGFAERALAIAERQETHRQRLESVVVEGGSKRATLGLILGFVIAAGSLIGAVLLVLNGYQPAGFALGAADFAWLAGAFVYGAYSRSQERKERADLMARTQAAMNSLGSINPDDGAA